MEELYVGGTARSRGVLCCSCCNTRPEAWSAALVALCLQTESYNTRAQQLYESVGFVNDDWRNLV